MGLRVNYTPPVGKSMKHSPMGGTCPLAAGQHVGKNVVSGDEGNMGSVQGSGTGPRYQAPEEGQPRST